MDVVVRTSETEINYYGDIYEPTKGCNYKVVHEINYEEAIGCRGTCA